MFPFTTPSGTFLSGNRLIHLLDQRIDLLLPVPQIATLHIMLEFPRPEPTRRVRQLERPEEIARLLEIRPHGHDLVHQVLNTDDTKFAEILLDDLVVREGNALAIDLSISPLVDEVADAFHGRIAVRDVWLDDLEHFRCCLCEADEDAVVDLEETKELHDFSGLRCHFGDTLRCMSEREWCKDRVSMSEAYPFILKTKTSLGSPGT